MSEESKELQGVAEVPEGDLAEANGGGMFGVSLGERIHRNCGGTIVRRDFLSIPAAWSCTKCCDYRDTLEEFDYYVVGVSDMPTF